jgi:hypothetical protein
MTNMYGIDHQTTTAYSKEENGLVERANKKVNRHLRNIIFDFEIKKEWAIYTNSSKVDKFNGSCCVYWE